MIRKFNYHFFSFDYKNVPTYMKSAALFNMFVLLWRPVVY